MPSVGVRVQLIGGGVREFLPSAAASGITRYGANAGLFPGWLVIQAFAAQGCDHVAAMFNRDVVHSWEPLP